MQLAGFLGDLFGGLDEVMLWTGVHTVKEGVKKVAKEGATASKNIAVSLVGRVAEYCTRKGINDLMNDSGKKLQ